MLYFSIIIISLMLAFLLRTFDIFLEFNNYKLDISLINSFLLLMSLTKNQFLLCVDYIKNQEYKEFKTSVINYLFHFNLLLTLMSSILVESNKALSDNEAPLVSFNEKDDILTKIKKSFPVLNTQQRQIA